MTLDAPPALSLIQWNEGEVAIQPRLPDDPNLPKSATHYRVYLSQMPGQLGELAATVTPIYTTDGPAIFQASKGTVQYATVHTYNTFTGEESDNTEQYRLQMYELLHLPYKITSYFHEPESERTWAIGVSYTGNPGGEVGLLRSDDYFSTWVVDHTWPLLQLNPYPDFPEFNEVVTFYMDKFGHKYVSARPLPLICRAGTDTWEPISDSSNVKYTTPESALLIGGWSIAEQDDNNTLIFAEYGEGAANQPLHHTLIKSTDPQRKIWNATTIDGSYRHIHNYLINPYNTRVHLRSLGDWLNSFPEDTGLFISTDGGETWGPNVLKTWSEYGTKQAFNAPCTETFYPSQKTLIMNDTHSQWAYLWTIGEYDWTQIEYGTSLVNDIFPQLQWYKYTASDGEVFYGYPLIPWSGMAIKGTYETYCTSCGYYTGNDFQHAPETLFRLDYGSEVPTSMIIAAARDYAPVTQGSVFEQWKLMSYSRGNVIPASARYVFSTMAGGMRIPREVSGT